MIREIFHLKREIERDNEVYLGKSSLRRSRQKSDHFVLKSIILMYSQHFKEVHRKTPNYCIQRIPHQKD